MVEITRDVDVCKKCGLCAMACGRAVFEQKARGTMPEIVALERCFACGHCVSVCPQGAISHSEYPEGTVHAINRELVPGYDQVLELIHSRRSKREYRDRVVEREVIEQVLEAARFAPSEHNTQTTEFIVVRDREMIREIGTLTASYYAALARRIRNPIGKAMFRLMMGPRSMEVLLDYVPEMEELVSLYLDGTDFILNDAPVLVLFCADSAGGFPDVNASLAVQNAILAAEAIGLGCFYAGFVARACKRDDKIARLVSLPETHGIYGVLAMGYPRVRFQNWPERNRAKVTWLEAA
jgi:nitroreductase/NAD-dependent dihydropyrimidine dehydrogenase PreA subunit